MELKQIKTKIIIIASTNGSQPFFSKRPFIELTDCQLPPLPNKNREHIFISIWVNILNLNKRLL